MWKMRKRDCVYPDFSSPTQHTHDWLVGKVLRAGLAVPTGTRDRRQDGCRHCRPIGGARVWGVSKRPHGRRLRGAGLEGARASSASAVLAAAASWGHLERSVCTESSLRSSSNTVTSVASLRPHERHGGGPRPTLTLETWLTGWRCWIHVPEWAQGAPGGHSWHEGQHRDTAAVRGPRWPPPVSQCAGLVLCLQRQPGPRGPTGGDGPDCRCHASSGWGWGSEVGRHIRQDGDQGSQRQL
ncbi:uncharacterized protein LOC119869565 [Canis lupus familiaris]|uniref:uncharacterized protein LOC119869565 n=1 Tax=Canis lupus familiaris TaxID=9615 RepID=UPI0018F29C7D|nr:uncharacterized protein LOC119869565 [Canis lupus familiaris]